ncbi:major facilitator superfamily domain-containing protein [Cladochytrium replicatum]|nr:major facilitator superfamily domain-containing protein [Cladochytrium replicatum]
MVESHRSSRTFATDNEDDPRSSTSAITRSLLRGNDNGSLNSSHNAGDADDLISLEDGERQPLLRRDQSYQTLVYQTVEKPKLVLQPAHRPPIRIGVKLVLFALFVAESSRGIVLPTLTAYIFHMGGDLSHVGYAVSCYSIGRLVSSGPFGHFVEKTNSTRQALILASVISLVFNVFYGLSFLFPNVWVIVLTRLFIGMSTGILGVARAYLASAGIQAASTDSKGESSLAKYIAWSGIVQYVGFSFTPLFSAVIGGHGSVSDLPDWEDIEEPDFVISSIRNSTWRIERNVNGTDPTNPSEMIALIECVIPPFILVILNIALVVMVLLWMEEKDITEEPSPVKIDVPAAQCQSSPPSPTLNLSMANTVSTNSTPSRSPVTVVVTESPNPELKRLLPNATLAPPIPVSEPSAPTTPTTLAPPTLTPSANGSPEVDQLAPPTLTPSANGSPEVDQLALRIAVAVFFWMNFAIRGVIGVVETIAPAQQQAILGNRPNLARDSAIYFTTLGVLGLVSFLGLSPVLKRTRLHANHMLAIGIGMIAAGLLFTLRAVYISDLVVFTVGMLLIWSIGSPICQTLTILSLSELMGKKPQAVIMSYLTNAGSLGRIV